MSSPFIEIKNLYKSFKNSKGETIQVLEDVNLDIAKGEMFGIMGFSGAGKSTLVRCINRLEEPDTGDVIIDGMNTTKLGTAELNKRREKIGMIFQTFNLFDSMTVFENIEFPLKATIKDKEKRKQRVLELADVVGLAEKVYDYPSQLSGGQKQRVGIARALANEPDVLLSDEATSALDPQTTLTVLDLLKKINREFGVTMILITHEIEVIKYACDKVAIIESGKIIEEGTTVEVLEAPKSKTAKIFTGVESSLAKAWEDKKGGAR